MSHRIIIRSKAEDDIANAAQWYEMQHAGLGGEFAEEIRAAIIRAGDNAIRFPSIRSEPDVCRVLAKRFPYRIFFVRRPSEIVVFRVLHTARHDREWKSYIPSDD
jgi:plasmid stabilization system protein ParE